LCASKEQHGRPERAGPRRQEADGRARQHSPAKALSAVAPLPAGSPPGGRAPPRPGAPPWRPRLSPTAAPTPLMGGCGGRAPPRRLTWRTTRSSTRAQGPRRPREAGSNLGAHGFGLGTGGSGLGDGGSDRITTERRRRQRPPPWMGLAGLSTGFPFFLFFLHD